MQVELTGHHVDITEALRAKVDAKMQRIERHLEDATKVVITLSVEKRQHKAEAEVSATGSRIYVESTTADMYQSLDSMFAKLDRRIRNRNDKRNNHNRKEVVHHALRG